MNNTEKLLKLAKENPDLPIIPMVYTEVVAGDEYAHWLGEVSSVEIGEYYICEENNKVYTDIIELSEYIADKHMDDEEWVELTNEVASEKAMQIAKALMTKAIIIYIDTPEV